jgi:hypothetical protein
VEISDNGIGRERAREISVAKNKKHKSRGLINIQDRITLLERTHGIKITTVTTDLADSEGKAAGTFTKISFRKTNSK